MTGREGWQVAMTSYRNKILVLLNRMDDAKQYIRNPNMDLVWRYIESVRPVVERMLQSFQCCSPDHLSLLPRFQTHIDAEESRLRQGLETVRYELDELVTIALINGRNGLERVSAVR